MLSAAALLADLHAQAMRDGEQKHRLMLATFGRHAGSLLVNSGRTAREEPTTMTPFGYTYRAEILCPGCTREAMIRDREMSPAAREMRVEDALDQVAEANGFDRQDETTFDSDEFPKVVFDQDVPEGEVCGSCGGEL